MDKNKETERKRERMIQKKVKDKKKRWELQFKRYGSENVYKVLFM